MSNLSFQRESQPEKNSVSAFVADLMAGIQQLTGISGTYEDLTWKYLNTLPVGYPRVDILADTYRDNSIKAVERSKRGSSDPITIRTSKSIIPSDVNIILRNGKNKTRMIELILEVMERNILKCLDILGCTEIYFSRDNECKRITHEGVTLENDLCSNQEEADTKVILHSKHAFDRSPEKTVIVRSPSGDTDIIVLMINMFIEHPEHFFIDSGSGKNRKGFRLNQINMDSEVKKSLIGFHAFTGNDYVSSFYNKGKTLCWKVLEKNPKFREAFQDLGSTWELDDKTFDLLNEYVCKLYGYQKKNVNQVRYHLFQKKYEKEEKIIDISMLPPCESVLLLHAKRANFVAKILRSSNEPQVEIPDISMHGWDVNMKIKWLEKEFPDDIEDLLIDSNIDEEVDTLGRDEETDDEENDDEEN